MGMASGRVLDWLGQVLRKGAGPVRGGGPVPDWNAVAAGVQPAYRPIERLAADLHRLGEESMRLHADRRISARAFHLHVTELAYDDTLLLACRALEVDTCAARSPLSGVRRMEFEIELARRGLRW
jgi:hypothetical protein